MISGEIYIDSRPETSSVFREVYVPPGKESVWTYFLKCSEEQTAKCKSCMKILKTTKGSTKGLHDHLKLHSITVNKLWRTANAPVVEMDVDKLTNTTVFENEKIRGPTKDLHESQKLHNLDISGNSFSGSTVEEADTDEMQNSYSFKDVCTSNGESSIWSYYLVSYEGQTARCKFCFKDFKITEDCLGELHNHLQSHSFNINHMSDMNNISEVILNETETDDTLNLSDEFKDVPVPEGKASIWTYYLKCYKKQTAKCKLCLRVLKTSGGSTKGLHDHLKLHNINVNKRSTDQQHPENPSSDPDWIRPIPYDVSKALCLFCKRHLRAHHNDLLSHVKTAKHQRNEALYSKIVNCIQPDPSSVMPVEEEPANHSTVLIAEEAPQSYVETELTEDNQMQVGILTVSDRCFRGEAEDASGPNLATKVKEMLQASVAAQQCVPDDITEIQNVLLCWCDQMQLDVILTTGGTGFSPRDVTPEATSGILEKHAPGMATAMTLASLKKTSMAMLSRAVCGTRGKSLIINLPGSKKGSQECFETVCPVISHAVDQLQDNRERIAQVHENIPAASPEMPQQHSEHSCEESKPSVEQMSVSAVAFRARSSPYPVISVSYAQNIIMKEAVLQGTEMVHYRECNGRYLVNDVVSSVSMPPFRASIKDGYAVIAADGAGIRQVLGEASAGSDPEALKMISGSCVRISTGAPVPVGADAVVQVEDTELVSEKFGGAEEVEVKIVKAPRKDQDIRPVGSDIVYGQTILERHQKLGPSELGLLATVGVTSVCVFKKPIVSVLSTGSEILEPGEPLRDGCIWDSNKTCIVSMLEEHNYVVKDCGIAKDMYDVVVTKLEEAFHKGSVVITTGGVSMGEKDLVKQILKNHFKAKIHFGRVFMKPGKPTTFATCTYEGQKKLVFALPGNPVSAVVTFNLFVLPALRAMSGDLNHKTNLVRVKLEHGIRLDPRPEYHRAVVTWHEKQNVPTACTTGNQISSRLLSMKLANAILVLPPHAPDKEAMQEGEIVDAIIIARI